MKRMGGAFGGMGPVGIGLIGAALAMLAGCGSPNEVMIAVHTDMTMPDDIDTIEIRVRDGDNNLKFQQPYESLGSDGANARLPITLGLFADEAGAPVVVQVVARTGGPLGAVRVLREVSTTMPEERVALLHVPLHYLCDGSGEEDASGNVSSTSCAAGQTCVAGSCAPIEVDSSLLADYAPGDVYGGGSGNGGDGECFDVTACFAGATEVTALDTSDCSFTVDGEVNVALRTTAAGESSNGGFCGAAGCLVALDEDEINGYRRSGARIQLPAAVCAKLGMSGVGRVEGVVTAPVTGECAKKRMGLPTCGAWSAAGG